MGEGEALGHFIAGWRRKTIDDFENLDKRRRMRPAIKHARCNEPKEAKYRTTREVGS